ncbi:unnamed protein product [Zymoseptoria tritici ST99CH_3D7]|uniref:Uncharacterized protein n=1 Tax=Zymoseptoria tritici (strain ST99CH_3D7) TaxID=1276538 RepID=A0A1X7RKG9_ZYMT9|nr:unnamed protein product [Zymoseptoria tritici ST99CH_3D7]
MHTSLQLHEFDNTDFVLTESNQVNTSSIVGCAIRRTHRILDIEQLGDGNKASRDQPAQRALLNEACSRRIVLAQYQRFPEGYEFEHHLVGEQKARTVILLSPPDLVAIRDEDGIWARHTRQEEEHGPPPYSADFYSMYLYDSGLPSWFLTKDHRDMSVTNREQVQLGIQHTPHPQYLEVRYPTTPMRPIANGAPNAFKLNMSEEDQLKLARNFPVTNLLKSGYLVDVVSDGYVVIDLPPALSAQLKADDVTWISSDFKSSYIIEEPANPRHIQLTRSDPQRRQELIEAAERDEHGMRVNPNVTPEGDGYWDWLQAEVDSERAKVLDIFDPAEMAAARLRGFYRKGMSRTESPAVIWRLHNEAEVHNQAEVHEGPPIQNLWHWNPSQQPPGQGVWKFAEEAAREKAAQLFGNAEEFNMAGNPFPDAATIFTLRLQFQFQINKGRIPSESDPTQSITLVWEVAAQADYPPGADVIKTRAESPSADDASLADELPPPDHDYGYDERSMLRHDPMNGGKPGSPNDQRGLIGEAHYMTANIHGTIITLDRSPAQQHKPHQSHKLRVFDTRWNPYQPAGDEFDWSDAASIVKLNKWRNQIMNRRQWPKLREMHKTCTTEQRTWLLENAMLDPGAAPHLFKDIADQFNERFGLLGREARDARTINNVCRLLRGQQVKAEEEADQRRAEVMKPEVKKAMSIDDILKPHASVEQHTGVVSKKDDVAAKHTKATQDSGFGDDGQKEDVRKGDQDCGGAVQGKSAAADQDMIDGEDDVDSLGSDADADYEDEDMDTVWT